MKIALTVSHKIDANMEKFICIDPARRRIAVRNQGIERISGLAPEGHTMNRREWAAWAMRLGLISTVPGFMVAASGCSQQLVEKLGELLSAAVFDFAVSKLSYAVQEAIDGNITLVNDSDKDATGVVDMKLLSSRRVVSGGLAMYSVPARTMNTYQWSGLASNQPGTFIANAQTAFGEANTDSFDVG